MKDSNQAEIGGWVKLKKSCEFLTPVQLHNHGEEILENTLRILRGLAIPYDLLRRNHHCLGGCILENQKCPGTL